MPAGRKRPGLVLGLVGATGLVGTAILRVLEERRFPVAGLRLWASSRSKGRRVRFKGRLYPVRPANPDEFRGCHIVLFAGTEGEKGASRLFARAAIERGAVVIDNGSDFRLEPWVPLVVPEVNPEDVRWHRGLIANPNCSTIQMAVALAPIHRRWRLRRVVVATYQSVSGAGRPGLSELRSQIRNSKFEIRNSLFGGPIAGNVIPRIGEIGDLGYTGEEWKMVREARRILHDDRIAINATTVRVPVAVGHAESIYFELAGRPTAGQLARALRSSPGIVFSDKKYYTPRDAAGQDGVLVSRLRADPFDRRAFTLWAVADNVRKGAATNAVQIAELVYKYRVYN